MCFNSLCMLHTLLCASTAYVGFIPSCSLHPTCSSMTSSRWTRRTAAAWQRYAALCYGVHAQFGGKRHAALCYAVYAQVWGLLSVGCVWVHDCEVCACLQVCASTWGQVGIRLRWCEMWGVGARVHE